MNETDINKCFVSRIVPETFTGFTVPAFVPPSPGTGLSLLFTGASSQYLQRTGNASANQQKFTFATWYKRNSNVTQGLSADTLYSISTTASGGSEVTISFSVGDILFIRAINSGTGIFQLTSTQGFNDVTAWHHFLVAVDTTQVTAANRVKFYMDGVQITSTTGTLPTQNVNMTALALTNANSASVCSDNATGIRQAYFDGFLTQTYYIDGQQLDPTSFASGSPLIPITYTGTYTGVFDFFLNYIDPTSLATLGLDRSGEGNNWTLVNMAVSDSSSDYPPSTPPPINHSLIFTAASHQSLAITGSTSINQQKFTYAFWFKRASTGTFQYLFDFGISNNFFLMLFDNTDTLEIDSLTGGVQVLDKITTATYTDTTSWHHICLAVDTTQATAANRIRLYVDGTEVVSWGTNIIPAQNTNLSNNFAADYGIGWNQVGAGLWFNGNLAGFYYIDGQQLDPTSFITGTPGSPKTYTGTYSGVFDFFLPFYNGTSTTTLGYDYSTKGNNWSLTNMTVSNQSADHP